MQSPSPWRRCRRVQGQRHHRHRLCPQRWCCGDTITFSGAVNFEGSVFGGDGSDVLEVKNASEFSDARFGAGADKLSSNVVVSASGATIAMGAGKDTLQLDKAGQLASATIFGGGGTDTITISATTDDSMASKWTWAQVATP